jgi:hypothetical protein
MAARRTVPRKPSRLGSDHAVVCACWCQRPPKGSLRDCATCSGENGDEPRGGANSGREGPPGRTPPLRWAVGQGASSLFRSLGVRLRPPKRRQANAEPGSMANKKSRHWSKRGGGLLRHRCQRRLRVRANALDHGTEPVRSLRSQVLAQTQPLKHRDRVGR